MLIACWFLWIAALLRHSTLIDIMIPSLVDELSAVWLLRGLLSPSQQSPSKAMVLEDEFPVSSDIGTITSVLPSIGTCPHGGGIAHGSIWHLEHALNGWNGVKMGEVEQIWGSFLESHLVTFCDLRDWKQLHDFICHADVLEYFWR